MNWEIGLKKLYGKAAQDRLKESLRNMENRGSILIGILKEEERIWDRGSV